jgi:hypothetical protein
MEFSAESDFPREKMYKKSARVNQKVVKIGKNIEHKGDSASILLPMI